MFGVNRKSFTKPPHPLIDGGHWFGRHIKSAFLPNNQNAYFDPATRGSWAVTANATIRAGKLIVPAATDWVSQTVGWSSFTEATVVIKFCIKTLTQNNSRFFGVLYSGGDDIRFFTNASDQLLIAWDDGTITNQTFSALTAGDEYVLVASHDGSTQRSWLFNTTTNSEESFSDSDSCTFSGFDGLTEIGATPASASDQTDCEVEFCYIANKAIRVDSQARSIAYNPYHALQTQRKFIPVDVPAVGGGRIMGGLAGQGGLAGHGGIAGPHGGLAG